MVEGGLQLRLVASSVRLPTRSSALCFREKRVEEVSLHSSLVPQAVRVLPGWAVVVLVCERAERQIKIMELVRCFAGARHCWREPAGHWAGRAACSAAQPHPPLLAQPFTPPGSEGRGQTCTPRYGQVPGSCLHCPLVCLRAGRCRCRPARTLHWPRPCGSISEVSLSGQERARKPRITPPQASSPRVLLGSGL